MAPARPNGILQKYIVLKSPAEREWEIPGTETATTIDDVFVPNVKYTFTITAVNQDFHGDKSKPMSFVYDPNTILSKVQHVRMTDPGKQRIKLTWDQAKGDVKDYLVQLKSSNPFDFGNQEFVTDQYEGKVINNIF